jgi:hypothetical protein
MVWLAGGPNWLLVGFGVAVAGLIFSRRQKLLAVGAAVLAVAGLIVLFVVPPATDDLSTWFIVVPRVLLGLATLTSVMVFVERD